MKFPDDDKPRRRLDLRLLVIVSMIPVSTGASAETVTHRYEKASKAICLSHEAGDVDFYLKGRASPFGNAPRFLVPAPYLTPDIMDDPVRTGIGAAYFPLDDLTYAGRIRERTNPPPGACLEEPFDHGLISLKTNEDYNPQEQVPARCRVLPLDLQLVPEDKSIPLAMRCPLSPRTGACEASYHMGNGWEAQFLVSVGDIPEWEDHVQRVTDFFENSLEECEPE
ncbi:hypothetical protein EF888_09410 [Silicimonas algicola]|nr:hypothetical protein [Silicimonas algicola]AZQ67323.1 hypothetical protein EF888_09410 [Silicimonas algicola]